MTVGQRIQAMPVDVFRSYVTEYIGPPRPYENDLEEAAAAGPGLSISDGPPDEDEEEWEAAPHNYDDLSARSDPTHAAEARERGGSNDSAGSAGNISQQQEAADNHSDDESKRPESPTSPDAVG